MIETSPVLVPQVLTAVAVGAMVVGLLATIVGLSAYRRGRRLEDHYRTVMTGVDGRDLAAALEQSSRRLDAAERRLAALDGRASDLDARLRRAVQRVGLSRYSAYGESAGEQSFTLALLDDARDGVVVSGLHGRSGTRVYAKGISHGRSDHALTDEEAKVVGDLSERRAADSGDSTGS